ncbi:MAG: hypothetical protein J6K24_04800 [Tidjanibacter sp.]|nr:hypothetical protein [Tidjanibacter sp.]
MGKLNTYLLVIITAALCLAGCSEPVVEEPPKPAEPLYGNFLLGEEEIPANSFTSVDDEVHLLLKISPLEDILSATTYAIVGVRKAFVGNEIDVTTKFHNDDYIFVYEDPTRYYAPWRQLQSGTILLDKNAAGEIYAKVNIVLSDGTPFHYEQVLVAK